jgi:hypothetical protein
MSKSPEYIIVKQDRPHFWDNNFWVAVPWHARFYINKNDADEAIRLIKGSEVCEVFDVETIRAHWNNGKIGGGFSTFIRNHFKS